MEQKKTLLSNINIIIEYIDPRVYGQTTISYKIRTFAKGSGHLPRSVPICTISASNVPTIGQNVSLTLNPPIATKVVCFSHLLKWLRSLYDKQCGPRSEEQSVLQGPRCFLLYLSGK